jgi:hypothetical protein
MWAPDKALFLVIVTVRILAGGGNGRGGRR